MDFFPFLGEMLKIPQLFPASKSNVPTPETLITFFRPAEENPPVAYIEKYADLW
jgi:hypothetical protein